MKKLFLCTTVLTAGLFVADAMAANGPKITVGGVADAQIAVVDQDVEFPVGDQDVIFRNDNEIHFSIDGKSDGGLEYGAVIELEADVSGEESGALVVDYDTVGALGVVDVYADEASGINADKTYIYLQGANWGRLEFGSNNAASDTLKLDADTFARGTGGIGGDSRYYINNAAIIDTTNAIGFVALPAIIRPDLPMGNQYGYEALEESNKVTYYTPNFEGFQAGVSYTPEPANRGQDIYGDSGVENVFSIGVKYEGQFDEFGFGIAAAADIGEAESSVIEDLMAWNVGANFSFAGFTIGGSYADQGDSLMTDNFDASYYTAGISYANEQFGIGVGYFASEIDDDNVVLANRLGSEFQNIVVSADYNLAPGILPYAEVSIFEAEYDMLGAEMDNDGTVVLIGTELTF